MDLPFPFGGRSEELAPADQEPGTTRQERNVHGVRPSDGRRTGAQRRGLRPYGEGPVVPGKRVQALDSIVFDSKVVDYAARASGEEATTWSGESVHGEASYRPVRDVQGNSYVIEGRGTIVKRNADGRRIWTFDPPCTSDQNRILALAIDQDDDALYTAIGADGDQAKGKLWRLDQLPDDKVAVGWTVDLDGFVTHLAVVAGELYAGIEQPDRGTAALLKFTNLFEDAPAAAQAREGVPFPIGGMAVTAEGIVYTTHPANATRGKDPRARDSTAKTAPVNMWTPQRLAADENRRDRLWRWFLADDIAQEDGTRVTAGWPDRSGHGGHLYPSVAGSGTDLGSAVVLPPLYFKQTLGALPGVRFGDQNPMESRPNYGTDPANLEQQMTVLPAYTNSVYAFVAMMRVTLKNETGPLIFQDNADATETRGHGIYLNHRETAPAGPSQGRVARIEKPRPPFSPLILPEGTYSGVDGFCVVSVIHRGMAAGTSQFRVNGVAISTYDAEAFFGSSITKIGWTGAGGTLRFLTGDVLEMVTIRGGDPSDAIEDLPDLLADVERTEGYMSHRAGFSHRLPAQHPYSLQNGPPRIETDSGVNFQDLASTSGILAKWGAARFDLRATLAPPASRGLGYSVAVSPTAHVWCLGPGGGTPTNQPPGDEIRLLRLADLGSTFSSDPADGGTFADVCLDTAFGTGADGPMRGVQMAVDGWGNCYVPLRSPCLLAGAADADVVGVSPTGSVVAAVSLTGAPGANGVACLFEKDDYADDPVSKTADLWIASPAATASEPVYNTYRVSQVTTTPNGSTSRETRAIAVAGGYIRTLEPAVGLPILDDDVPDPPLDPDAAFIDTCVAFGKVFFSDGKRLVYLDARRNRVSLWKSTTAGKIPDGPRLLAIWRARVMLARFPTAAQNWFALRQGDPFDADTRPDPQTATQAIPGNNARAGQPSDIITALIPWDEDTFLFGGDHTISQLSGDPMAAGTIDRAASRMDLLSPTVGIAFGRAWARDRNGILYFHDNRGGIHRMVAGSKPENITDGKVENTMRAVDLRRFRPVLAYDDEMSMLHVFYVANDPADASIETQHFLYEIDQATGAGAWWTVTFGAIGLQPTCTATLEGDDPADRKMLIGCEDGYVRVFDRDAPDDDGVAIDSMFLVGPLAPESSELEFGFNRLTVMLANDEGGANYKLYGTDRADNLGDPKRVGELVAGRNPPIMDRVRGAYVAVEIGSAQAGNRWSLAGAMQITATARGTKKERQ